ncbi:MAG: RNase adapter RapZ [Deltaproteobacteria bacterium]|nr:MAG: RNase adapter RapZ [Deltaproteobacteria bacterium]
MHLVLISGLSGSGKSTALKALEDSGYFCVDNLPASLLPTLIDLCRHSSKDISKVAMVVDIRGREFLGDLRKALEAVRAQGHEVRVLFLEAADEVLIARFSETRRKHPLQDRGGSLSEAVRLERGEMSFLRDMADEVIDTTDLTGHQLRVLILERLELLRSSLKVSLLSFGYSFGLPPEADLVMDVRFLPNPFYVKELRDLDGLDERVRRYIFDFLEGKEFLRRFLDLLDYLLPLYEREGKSLLTVAVGCTGGRHRSPAVVQELGHRLKGRGREVTLRHRDLRGLEGHHGGREI